MEKQSSKKKFDLSSDMIRIETSDMPTVVHEMSTPIKNINSKSPRGTQPPIGKVKLTLSVPEEFLPEYKSWCIKHKLTMSDAIVEALILLKQKYGY